ncbi:MAG: bifunctional glycosyltransferase/CDP-glycerol:glycerophosphate glycerophosphotransferase [Vicinamibacterales bacterium]
MPAVSVIMPAYNAEAYLGRAVQSVLHQSFADLELLVVDDGSSDRTAEIARGFAVGDARVRVLEQPNAGPGPARNAGFRAASGRLFAFLDSDDEWAETFLAEHVSILDAQPSIDILVGNARNRGGAHHNQPVRPVENDGRLLTLATMLGDERALFIMTVFRRTVIDAVGGFDPALFTNEEYEMWIRAALAGFTFARHPKPLGWYSCRSGSLSSSDARMLSGILRVFAKTRPALAPDSPERAILERQVTRFEMELLAANARSSLQRGDAVEAARHLSALHARRGGRTLRLASTVTALAPRLALAAYRLRTALRRSSTAERDSHPASGAAAVGPVQTTSPSPLRAALRAARRIDRTVGHWIGPRRVLVDLRNSMHGAVLEPITAALERDPRVAVYYTSARLDQVGDRLTRAPAGRILTHQQIGWRRWDLYLSADPWTRPTLHRCARYANLFHGVAGKYDLDNPAHLPIAFHQFDRVLFINRDRMERYLAAGLVSRERAVLVGFPKVDRLVNGEYDGDAVRRLLGLEAGRPTALYAPTWSPASSLSLAGEGIITTLAGAGWNVIVKLHSLSLDSRTEKFSGGVDWRARMAALERPGRIVHVEDADASPLLAASDLMVTDHSTIGFEFCLLDRPLIVFDTPGLIEAARINPERVRQLRGAARVVANVDELAVAAREALDRTSDLSVERRRLASSMFYAPGSATDRAVGAAYDLLALAKEPQWRAQESCDRSASA